MESPQSSEGRKRKRACSEESETVQYVPKSLRSPLVGSPRSACQNKLTEAGYNCQKTDLRVKSKWEDKAMLEYEGNQISPVKEKNDTLGKVLNLLTTICGKVEDADFAERGSKEMQPRLARDVYRQCLVRQIEGPTLTEEQVRYLADSCRWQQTYQRYTNQGVIPQKWNADALRMIQISRSDPLIEDAYTSAHYLCPAARSSTYLHMLKSCEQLITVNISHFKAATVCALGRGQEDYEDIVQRFQSQTDSFRAQAAQQMMQSHGL